MLLFVLCRVRWCELCRCLFCVVCDGVNWWFYVAVCSVSSVNVELCFCLLLQRRVRPFSTIELYQRRQAIEHGHVLPQPAYQYPRGSV